MRRFEDLSDAEKIKSMIRGFKEALEKQDEKKYTLKEIEKILGKATLKEWRDELRWD